MKDLTFPTFNFPLLVSLDVNITDMTHICSALLSVAMVG